MIYGNKTIQYAVYSRNNGKAEFIEDTTTVTRPNMEMLTDTIKGAGILGEIDMPALGQVGALAYEIALRRTNKKAAALFAQKTQELEIRWVTDTINSSTGATSVVACKDIIKAVPKSLDGGALENNTANETTLSLEVLYIKHIQNGETLIEIDKLNNVFIVDGVDYAQIIRENL